MKLLVKYYDVWGRPVQMFINVSSKGKISDLKKLLSLHTDIASDQLEVTLVVDETQFQLVDDNLFLSEFPFSAKAIVYVGKKSDEFSIDLDNQIMQDSGCLKQFTPPDLSIESISIRNSLISNFTKEDNDQTLFFYSKIEFQKNILTMEDALINDQIELCKLILQRHNGKLRQIMEETKSQEQREEIAKEYDIINNVETTGWSLLHLATFNGKDKFLIWLISEGGDPSKRSKDEWDCLKLAVWQCQYEVLMLLVAQPNININDLSRHGTALHLAAQLDDIKSVKILLKHPKINISLLNYNKLRPIDLAGNKTMQILEEEAKSISKSFRMNNETQKKLLSMLTSSLIELTNLSQNVIIINLIIFLFLSFMVNLPKRPPIIKGDVYKVNYFKFCHYKRFVLLDPESGVLARFKRLEDFPLKPDNLISLETVNDVRISHHLWFQDENLYYIEITYINERIYFALKHKSAARQWYEALRNAVGYVKYINGKVQSYISQDWKKAQKNIVQIMLQKANQEILIKDDASEVDQKLHIKQQQIQKRNKYKNDLQSVSEHSLGEESGQQGLLEYNTTNNLNVARQLKVTDFEVLDYLGKGSFGNVYKVMFRQNQKIYALKQQSKQKMIKLNQLTYVKRELNILKQLHHPYLVHIHFAFQTNQYLYLVLDFCERGDLSNYMTRGVILEEITARFIIAEIILALEYLHEKNIIYRDLKPENIIVDDQGYIKLIDFGLSKEGQTRDIIAQSFCGSPAYLSPEIIAGQGSTKATDIYSLGTILYEMLTGYPPFYCNDLKMLLQNIRYQKLNIPNDLSRGAQKILSKMLEKNPENRIGGKNISSLKKHIFFADIDWEKLLMKKYIAPNLTPRPNHQSRALRDLEQYQGKLNIDPDDHCDQINEISGWDYGF